MADHDLYVSKTNINESYFFLSTQETTKSRTDPSVIKFDYIISQLNIHVALLVFANEFVLDIYHLYFTLSLHKVQKKYNINRTDIFIKHV